MIRLLILRALAVFALAVALPAADHAPLPLGSSLPSFSLPGIDGRSHTPADYAGAELLVIVFTSNHCPTAQLYEQRLIRLAGQYDRARVAFVAINPNSQAAVRLDEMGYTDLDDSLESMKIRAAHTGFNFPYLDDGATQSFSLQMGPAATPHVFVFDRVRKLRYQGRIDDSERESLVKEQTLKLAIDALLAGREPSPATTKAFGCSTKWADKAEDNRKWRAKVAQEPVALAQADAAALRELRANKDSGKVRVIHAWATWCGPCVSEFDQVVETNLNFRHRDFEMVTLAAQFPDEEARVLKFLKTRQASMRNLIFGGTDKYALIEALDPEWNGALPHTLVVAPDGKVIHRQTGALDFIALKRAIVPALNEISPWLK